MVYPVLELNHYNDHNKLIVNYWYLSIQTQNRKEKIERVIHNQLYNYFEKNKLFYKSWYDFSLKHLTELASLEVIDKTIFEMDNE